MKGTVHADLFLEARGGALSDEYDEDGYLLEGNTQPDEEDVVTEEVPICRAVTLKKGYL